MRRAGPGEPASSGCTAVGPRRARGCSQARVPERAFGFCRPGRFPSMFPAAPSLVGVGPGWRRRRPAACFQRQDLGRIVASSATLRVPTPQGVAPLPKSDGEGGLRLGSFCKMEESPLDRQLWRPEARDRGKALLPLQRGLDKITFRCMDRPRFVYSSSDGHLLCFHSLAVVTSAVVNVVCKYPLPFFWLDVRGWDCGVTWWLHGSPFEKPAKSSTAPGACLSALVLAELSG